MKVIDKIIAVGKFIVDKLWWIGLVLFVYVFIFAPITEYKSRQKYDSKYYCVTIAHTIGRAKGRISEYEYIYYVNGVEYHSQSVSGLNLVRSKDGKYLIKYRCDNPQDALIYFDKPIKGDTIPAEYLK